MAKDRVLQDIGPKELTDWFAIQWQAVKKRVRNLRRRIFRASQNAQWKQVRSLMKLMLRSFSNLLLSVRKVTQENKGRRTPGVDRQLALTPQARVKLVRKFKELQTWKVKPAKRVYNPKADGKQRPLGILTIQNRVAQAVVKNALEPYCESRFESHSYGFRPGRSCHDAIEQCWRRLNRHGKDRWVLDADIKSAFDAICHKFILSELKFFPARELLKQWLNAGYVESEVFHDTTAGVPQGGIVSPVIANIAFDGLQKLTAGASGFVRYADDFIVTARRKEDLQALLPVIEEWLLKRGMMLHPDKTRIVHIQDGFDFLGFNIRQYHGTCLVKPQKEKVFELLQRIRLWLRKHPAVKTEEVVQYLNPILRGWVTYYRHASSKQVFDYVKHQLWMTIWKWCLRRHPNKSYSWIKAKYFVRNNGQDWQFHATIPIEGGERVKEFLVNPSDTPIRRFIKVRGVASPDNPELAEYWELRKTRKHRASERETSIASKVRKMLEA